MSGIVAVTGGTGKIGSPLIRALLAAGRPIRALSRRERPDQPGVEWLTGDVLDPDAVAALVAGTEMVFHCAGQLTGTDQAIERSLVEGTANVLRAARNVRTVHISSLVVLDTGSATSPELIDETAPLEPCPDRRGSYTRGKVHAEALARAASVNQDVVVVRPGLVVSDGIDTVPLSIGFLVGRVAFLAGPANANLPAVHAADVASGLVCAAARLEPGSVLHLVDPAPVSRAQLLRRIAGNAAPLPTGGLAIALAGWFARTGGRAGNNAYRLLSAGRPHGWAAERAASLGWRPVALRGWLERTDRIPVQP